MAFDTKNIIGIDIGGTKISGVVYNGKKVIDELTIVTPKNLFEFERNLLKLVDFLSAKKKVFGLGIGIAGLVDQKNGHVRYSPNIKFIRNLDLAKMFKINGIKKVKMDNDANCFARAELMLGQGRKFNNFLVLTLGTGIGGGIVINRHLYRGQNNFGGEFGHTVLGDEFFEAAYKRFRDKKDFKRVGRVVGKALASFINIFEPEAVIIGGGFGSDRGKKYLPAARAEIGKFLFDKNAKTRILVSQLKNAGALGAALMFN